MRNYLFLALIFLFFKEKMPNNVDIFIGCHKTFEPRVTNDAYKIIVGNHEVENKSNLELIKCGNKDDILDDKFYSEIYMLKWLVDNRPLKDYVGFCHYRKYFEFMDDVPDMDEAFKVNDVITATPIRQPLTELVHFCLCHNYEDMGILGMVIRDKYPDYFDVYKNVMKNKIMIPYNMTIMKKDDYIEYINFIWNVLQDFVNVIGTDIEGRILNNKDKYFNKIMPNNNTLEYQYRIGGYLAERLTNVFVFKKFKYARFYKAIITDKKL